MNSAWMEPPDASVAGVEDLGAEPPDGDDSQPDDSEVSLADLIADGQNQVRRGVEQLAQLQAAHQAAMARAWEFVAERRSVADRRGEEVDPWG